MGFDIVVFFIVSVLVTATLFLIISKERRSGRRFFASRVRSWFDVKIDRAGDKLVKKINHFVKYIVQLNWYYSIHSVLRTIMKVTVAVYSYVENVFEKNRYRTKKLRVEKRQLEQSNHLQQMADYKKDTMLTPAQQRKLKKKELEGK